MSENEKAITDLEDSFPKLAGMAFAKAREETLAAGLSVLQSEDGVIYEVFPDGRKIERKRIEPPTYVGMETKAVIR